jgi:hypothetical protein
VLGHGVMGSAAGSTLAVSRLSYEEALGGFSGVHLYWSSFNAEHPFSNRHDGVLGLHGGQSLDLPWERRLSPDMPRSCPRAFLDLEDVFTIMIPQNTGVITLNSAELIGSSTQTI